MTWQRMDKQARITCLPFPCDPCWNLSMRQNGQAESWMSVDRVDAFVGEKTSGDAGGLTFFRCKEVHLLAAVLDERGVQGLQVACLTHRASASLQFGDRIFELVVKIFG